MSKLINLELGLKNMKFVNVVEFSLPKGNFQNKFGPNSGKLVVTFLMKRLTKSVKTFSLKRCAGL